MPATSPTPGRTRLAPLVLLTALGACATNSGTVEKLPFHVAIAPAAVVLDKSVGPTAGNPTELALRFDEKQLTDKLVASLAETFVVVTRLSPAGDGASGSASQKAWVGEAQQKGADLLVVPSLRYNSKVHTELNDRFWLNLPLFALGGPFCWFVADRSYHCYARLDGEVFDVTAAAASRRQSLDRSNRVHEFRPKSTEASLSFLQRADGAGSYLLSVICPAGLLATESTGVPPELDTTVSSQLCGEMTQSLRNGATEITEADLVDFFPQNVRVDGQGNRALRGEFVLKLGRATELGKLRYRAGPGGAWRDGSWGAVQQGASPDRKVYPFAIALDGATGAWVQVEVEQVDQDLTKRTFTFATRVAAKT